MFFKCQLKPSIIRVEGRLYNLILFYSYTCKYQHNFLKMWELFQIIKSLLIICFFITRLAIIEERVELFSIHFMTKSNRMFAKKGITTKDEHKLYLNKLMKMRNTFRKKFGSILCRWYNVTNNGAKGNTFFAEATNICGPIIIYYVRVFTTVFEPS